MKQYFVTADIHSFYSIFKKELDKTGFDISNSNHILIVCGDVFDRGDETIELYNFLMSIPKERLILVKGNHEELYIELLNKNFPEKHDFSNGTVKTFCAIANCSPELLQANYLFTEALVKANSHKERTAAFDGDYINIARQNWKKIVEVVKKHPITEWITSDVWRDYYEINNYIFVHSFIPTVIGSEFIGSSVEFYPTYELKTIFLAPYKEWRNATTVEWSEARWGNPFEQYDTGLYLEDKYLVHGHWHCSDGHQRYENIFNCFTPCIHDRLISIDACTAYSAECNIIVIKDNYPYVVSKLTNELKLLKPIPIIETVSLEK